LKSSLKREFCGIHPARRRAEYLFRIECKMQLRYTGMLVEAGIRPPAWLDDGKTKDRRLFQRIIANQRRSERQGSIVELSEAFRRANNDQRGGLRGGNLLSALHSFGVGSVLAGPNFYRFRYRIGVIRPPADVPTAS
jgi:hypothetical protein